MEANPNFNPIEPRAVVQLTGSGYSGRRHEMALVRGLIRTPPSGGSHAMAPANLGRGKATILPRPPFFPKRDHMQQKGPPTKGKYEPRMKLLPGEPVPVGDYLKLQGCRFIHGEPRSGPKGWRCCGHPRVKGSEYCKWHFDHCYRKEEKKDTRQGQHTPSFYLKQVTAHG